MKRELAFAQKEESNGIELEQIVGVFNVVKV